MLTRNFILSVIALLTVVAFTRTEKMKTVWLDELPIRGFSADIRPIKTKISYTNDSLLISGQYFQRGIGVQSISAISFALNGHAKRFIAAVGVDDHANKDIALQFYVVADKKVIFASGNMRVGDKAKPVDVSLEGVRQIGLLVTDTVGGVGNKKTNGNWANAQLLMEEGSNPAKVSFEEEKYLLTPPAKKSPSINGAKIVGATPGNPFLFAIPVTGIKPIVFSANNLPVGLSLDKTTGIISGKVMQKGSYEVLLGASNPFGKEKSKLTIRIGDTIALTPPMGWNGWNCWEERIDREKTEASANAMVSSGLKDHGWSYINIDDSWQGKRGGELNALQPNEKFPRMKEMVDHIHAIGLKAGIYSTPYIASYAGYPGASSDSPRGGETHQSIMLNRRAFNHPAKYRFEKEDALQMAEWGMDFIKYDWRIDTVSTRRMSEALRHSGRDIVFSLSNSAPFEYVNYWMRLSNMYRTGPDIQDSWLCLYLTTFTLDKWSPYGGPGHWNDADMMILGNVSIGSEQHPTRLTPHEQYSHVSMYSLLASPMLLGCPLDQLDAFTLNLLSNDEVIAINQDALGKPARLVLEENGMQVWSRPLADGSYAVGIFNTDFYAQTPVSYFKWGGEKGRNFTLDLSKIGLPGQWNLRDVWRQQDLGTYGKNFTTPVPHHGVVLLKVSSTGMKKK